MIAGIERLHTVADDGAILVTGQIDAPGENPTAPTDVVLRVDGDGAHVLASTSLAASAAIRFSRVTATNFGTAGAAIVSGCQDLAAGARCGIYAVDGSRAMPLLTTGDQGVDGAPIGDAEAWAVASDGTILARTFPEGDYTPGPVVRLAGGRLLRVRGATDPLPDGSTFQVSGGDLNARGEVLLFGSRAAGPAIRRLRRSAARCCTRRMASRSS